MRFFDDDWLEDNCLGEMLSILNNYDTEVVISNFNVIEEDDDLIGLYRNDERHLESLKHHETSLAVLNHKWGKKARDWDAIISSKINDNNIYFVFYPYFEKDIYLNNQTLPKKRIVTLWDFFMFLIEKNRLILRMYKELNYQLKKLRK